MIEREILHLALAAYTSERAVERLAKVYKRRTKSPKVKRAMNVILNFEHSKAELAKRVYFEEIKKNDKS